MTINARIIPGVSLLSGGDADLADNSFSIKPFPVIEFLAGFGNNRADLVFADQRTLAGSATDSLDLAGGALSDPNGNALTFAVVKALFVRASPGNPGDIRVGGNANAFVGPFVAANDQFDVRPGDVAMHTAQGAGWTVVAVTGDILDIENLDAAQAIYDIVIIGASQ